MKNLRINCLHCGRFVSERTGSVVVEWFEFSNEIASADGECADGRCPVRDRRR